MAQKCKGCGYEPKPGEALTISDATKNCICPMCSRMVWIDDEENQIKTKYCPDCKWYELEGCDRLKGAWCYHPELRCPATKGTQLCDYLRISGKKCGAKGDCWEKAERPLELMEWPVKLIGELQDYLIDHSDDIKAGINDFGDLKHIYAKVIEGK